MNPVIKNYNSLVKRYQKIELDLTENEIHDKRVILRKIFPILAAYKIKPSKIKNGEKAFKLFGKLRDVQVQILKLESIDQTPEIGSYMTFLKDCESELKGKVSKFCKKKELVFPTIKKGKINKSKVYKKFDKSLNRLVNRIHLESIYDAEDIHEIRIEFKKFRYIVEVLSYIEIIDDSKLERLKVYQDRLGEIQDYEVLIYGLKKFYKKRKISEEADTEKFEMNQNSLIEKFDSEVTIFIAACQDIIRLENEASVLISTKIVSTDIPEDSANVIPNVDSDDKENVPVLDEH